MNTIREMAAQGKPVRAIARQLGLARNTVRKYVRAARAPAAEGVVATPLATHPQLERRPSKLDPYKTQIEHWVTQDHLYSCETMFRRLQALGYPGMKHLLVQPCFRWHR